MARFLFASTPIEGHSATRLPIITELIAAGHEVTWLAGAAFADRARATGASFEPIIEADDFSSVIDPSDFFPHLRQLRGHALIKAAFRDVFINQAYGQVKDLRRVLDRSGAEVIVADGLNFGVPIVSEQRAIPYVGIGDGPLGLMRAEAPPFGPAFRNMNGRLGKVRNRALNAVAQKMMADVQETYRQVRVDHGLAEPTEWVFDSMVSPHLHLQGCVPGFEYPFAALPQQVRFVGALRPEIPSGWERPGWWHELDQLDGRPMVMVTQGTIRPDATELLQPAIEALRHSDALVVVTTGIADPSDLGTLPSNVRAERFVPYELLLARASLFVSNGGYIGTNLALHHGVPVVQVGSTEEKAEIGRRIEWAGVGVRLAKTETTPALVGAAVERVLADDQYRARAAMLAIDYQRHDATAEIVQQLEQLVDARVDDAEVRR
jgi:MGT family glycosyltransferase